MVIDLERSALMIRYRAALSQVIVTSTTDERFTLLANVVFPHKEVYNASMVVAQRKADKRMQRNKLPV